MEDPVDQLVQEMQRLDRTESQTGRLSRKLEENPFLGVGLLGLVGACTLGAMRFNNRPSYMSASQYLMQLRVAAQGTVAGSLALGMVYKLLRRHPLTVHTEGRREEDPERLLPLSVMDC